MSTGTITLMANVTSLNSLDNTQKSQIVRGTAAFSSASDTYATGGLVTTFASGTLDLLHSDLVPTYIRIWSQQAASAPDVDHYDYQYNPGTTLANGKTQIWGGLGSSTPEFGNGTALTAPATNTLLFEAVLVRNV